MAMVIEAALRAPAGRHYRGAGEFPVLLSSYDRSSALGSPVFAALVVAQKMTWMRTQEFEWEKGVDLYESMIYWFVKEFVKAIVALAVVLGIVVFLWWINTGE
jgi:hypothetical protein